MEASVTSFTIKTITTKGIHDSNNNQIEPKEIANDNHSKWRPASKPNSKANISEFIKKLWKHCQLMKNNFKDSWI